MIRFSSDYQEGAHPQVLQRMIETNLVQSVGYGEDEYCAAARERIRELCAAPNADVHFLVGGTQTNFTFLSAAMRTYQGVVCADTAHIAVHETGSVEATGHKVITLPNVLGKLNPEQIDTYCAAHYADASFEHMVMPKVVYLSSPTELGTIYSRDELLAMRAVCDKWHLYLYLDGARLGYGLSAKENTLSLPFLAEVCDAFYIGGTKQGAMFGEALVISNDALKVDFRYVIKQKGGMLAKGRLLGVQYLALFEDNLYFRISETAIAHAMRLRDALKAKGYAFFIESPTNQQFPILPDAHIETLRESFGFSTWQKVDDTHTAVRFVTSWFTDDAQMDALIGAIEAL